MKSILKDLFFSFGVVKFILFINCCFFLASLYLQSAERKYTVEYNLKAVDETDTDTSFSGLGGFASIAGIQLPKASNNDFNIFKELITSDEVSEIIFEE